MSLGPTTESQSVLDQYHPSTHINKFFLYRRGQRPYLIKVPRSPVYSMAATQHQTYFEFMSVDNINALDIITGAMSTSPAFTQSPYQELMSGFLRRAINEKVNGQRALYYRVVPEAECPDGIIVRSFQPKECLFTVRVKLEEDDYLICDGFNAMIQIVRRALGPGDLDWTRAAITVSYQWSSILYDVMPAAFCAISISGTAASPPTAQLVERLAGTSSPGLWYKQDRDFKEFAQQAHRQSLLSVMKPAVADKLRTMEATARITSHICGEPVTFSYAEIGNCAEDPFHHWFMALVRRHHTALAKSGLTIHLVTMKTRSMDKLVKKIRHGMASMSIAAFYARMQDLMATKPGLILRFPPCWRCRLCITFAMYDLPPAINLHVCSDDATGAWRPVKTWTMDDLKNTVYNAANLRLTRILTTQGRAEVVRPQQLRTAALANQGGAEYEPNPNASHRSSSSSLCILTMLGMLTVTTSEVRAEAHAPSRNAEEYLDDPPLYRIFPALNHGNRRKERHPEAGQGRPLFIRRSREQHQTFSAWSQVEGINVFVLAHNDVAPCCRLSWPIGRRHLTEQLDVVIPSNSQDNAHSRMMQDSNIVGNTPEGKFDRMPHTTTCRCLADSRLQPTKNIGLVEYPYAIELGVHDIKGIMWAYPNPSRSAKTANPLARATGWEDRSTFK
ncbi:hypothetical protein CALCODRAFT_510529 [Calocera cornea HHB12733]|uniref:Uncharacterized protein n=1 Tax=Calocera cornea HHB12733 TaxID=1353952 RepID=A0A165EG25_9BASI|nr:hypothetical protein CALCODRAFT_510529 [Calocera cornea HHB12733]